MRVSTSTITINALRDAVWSAVTRPEYVRLWQYNSELTTSWEVGSPIRFSAEWEGQTIEQWGSVLAFDAPSRLSYSLFFPRPDLDDVPENYFTMEYELIDVAHGTAVSFIQRDPRHDGDVDESDTDEENPVLIALRAVAESLVEREP